MHFLLEFVDIFKDVVIIIPENVLLTLETEVLHSELIKIAILNVFEKVYDI